MNGRARRTSALILIVCLNTARALPAPPPKLKEWTSAGGWLSLAPNKTSSNLTVDLPPLAGKIDAVRAAALDARDAAVTAADAKLAAAGLPTVSDAVAKHVNMSASVRAAADGKAADAAAKLRREADSARHAADAASVNGTNVKSDAIISAAETLDAAADAVDVADLVAGHAADVKAAQKPARRTMTVLVALRLPGPFADATGVTVIPNDGAAVAGRRRLSQTTVPGQLTPDDAAALALARAGPAAANMTPLPDVVIDAPLVSAVGVRNAVTNLLRTRLQSLGTAAGLAASSLGATVASVDPKGGVYAVSVTFRGSDATAAALANAVNDVPPRERACAGWIERVGFDFCGALAATTPLVVDGVEARADFTTTVETVSRALSLGRRSNFPRGPASIGQPRIVVRTGANLRSTAYGMTPYDIHSKIKDFFWYIEKLFEGRTNTIFNQAAIKYSKELTKISEEFADNSDAKRVAVGAAENAFKAETLVAQKATNLLGSLRKVMAVLGAAAFVGTLIASFFVESQPDPKIMAALDTIQVVVNQTYALLKDVRAELDVIEGTLGEIKDQILSLECATLLQLRVDNFATIEKYWQSYNSTYLPLVQRKTLAKQVPSPTDAAEVDAWANNVVDNVERSMLAIGYALAGNDVIRPDQTVIASCGKFFAREAAKSDPFAADDRVAYFQITALTASMLMIVNRASTLLSEAHLWRAQRAYRSALDSYVATNCSANITLCPTFGTPDMPLALGELCARALADPSSPLPYSAAWTNCNEDARTVANARNITLRAMELMGAPYSWGDEPGQGVRLVLGTDVVRYQNTSLPFNAPSMWLVPASPGAFDPACTLPNATANAGCSLVGDFGDTSNATWVHLRYPLGIEAKYWQASPQPWTIMRYTANLTAVPGVTGDAASLLSRMEGTTMLTALGQVAFTNISDRMWWMPNTTFSASLHDFGLSHATVLPAESVSHERYYVDRDTMSVGTRCFVTAAANSTAAGLPTGVVCESGDMVALFDGPCIYNRWSGSSDFKFRSANELHDYSVACPITPRAWFAASQLGSRPDLDGRAKWPPATPLTVVCPALNKYLDDGGDAGTVVSAYASNQATCGLSVSKTTGAFRDGSCKKESDPSILYCHAGASYELVVYTKRTCSMESRFGDETVTPSADTCIYDPASDAAAHRLAYPIFDLASNKTTLPLSPQLRAQTPPPLSKLFRLPAVNVFDLPSIVSPFTGKPYCGNDRKTVFDVPRQCGRGATEFIVDTVGAGDAADTTSFPLFDAVNNTATQAILSLAPGTDRLTCAPVWVRPNGTRARADEIVTVGVLFVVAAGPVLAADAGGNFPHTVVDTYAGPGTPTSTLNLTSALPSINGTSVLARSVRCLVTGRYVASLTGLPVHALGAAYVLGTPPNARLVNADGAYMVDCGGGAIVDTNSDTGNCGSCGTVCPPGSTCVLGTCVCSLTVTSTQTLTATAARNVSVVLVGGGGGAAGTLSADDIAAGGSTGGGGGGGSSAVAVGGTWPVVVAPGGAGGAPSGNGSIYTATDAGGLPGDIVSGPLTLVAGDVITVYVGGGGGGGGALSSAALAQQQSADRRHAAGGAGGAGWFGGGGGWAGPTQYDATVHGRATGGGAAAGGAGSNPGTPLFGGNGNVGPVRSATTLGVPYARGGRCSTRGTGAPWYAAGTTAPAGGAGGGGACGGGGGAGSSGVVTVPPDTNTYGLDGGAIASDGGGGAAGASTWANGIKVGVGAGGRAGVMDGALSGPTSEGGAGGLAVLRWTATGGTCAF